MITGLLLSCLLTLCVQHKPTTEEVFGKPGGEDAQAEALVKRVKEQLAAVDAALQSAADADEAAAQLNAARQAHLSVIRDLEELIKQVKYSESQSSSSSGNSGKPSKSNSKGAPQPKPDPRESDGQQHSDPQSGAKPPQSEPQPADEKSEQKSGEPQSGDPNGQRPDQQPGDQRPPPPESGRFERQDTDARWGLLPPKVQERLMNLHVDDLPERYRTWMDAYIRQLNRLEQGGDRP